MKRPRRKRRGSPKPPPPEVVRPVVLGAAHVVALDAAVAAYYARECRDWVDKGYTDKTAEDWASAVIAPAAEALRRVVDAFDGAFD